MQNKVHFAIHGKTAAEAIVSRADRTLPNMGLTNWEGARIRRADVAIAKNYLNENELRALNNLVEQYLIFAEGQAERRAPSESSSNFAGPRIRASNPTSTARCSSCHHRPRTKGEASWCARIPQDTLPVIEIRQTDAYARWFRRLGDPRAQERLLVRIRRLSLGNPGDVRLVVQALDEAKRDLVLWPAVGSDPFPVPIDHRGELLVRLEPLPLHAATSRCHFRLARQFSTNRRAHPSRS